ncbi:MAG TPA: cupredoxin family copper-binding protein, partial [Ktedonobacteraceae bacterium]|nr:cupredoxin family copper-binding protein [Ktedonobacteraceae bacterium]
MQKTYAYTTTKAWLCLLALCLVVLLAACGSTTTTTTASTPTIAPTATPTSAPTTAPTPTPTTAPTRSGNSVSIANFAFSPTSLTVKVGTKVSWTNNDSVTHTVTADKGAFNSGPLAPGSTFSFTFTKAGTYSYHCNIHASMRATIVVQ